ncbi:hypothetical protein WICMUC_000859 [Wickerhamomyces mucosus]|uniref:Serine hydrolase domain-containing protein n=1 Tax=Wickerhamomyces mucosus TaxID=1378264 RepID=A0A9P8PWU4_9ASCO|nr:hypothetical protein WICMUC_000859 [Wickerhamomyces mucosus]
MSKKILFLHGYAQSASIFSAKTGGLRKSLQKLGYETIYIDAPQKIQGDETHSSSAIDMYGWWPYVADGFNIDEGLTAVRQEISKHEGEIEGIIGFSQGGGLTGIIASQYKEIIPSLKYIIVFSGFKLRPKQYDSYYEGKIQVPSLHVIGELDTVVEEERSLKLYDVSRDDNKTLLKHQGGHFVPNSRDFVTKVINWIQSIDTETVEKEEQDINDDTDLLDAIDNIGKA